jgi:hypothetical protein
MRQRFRVCNNCQTAYSPARRKCTYSACRAPKRFSCEEAEEAFAERVARYDRQEALLQRLAQA